VIFECTACVVLAMHWQVLDFKIERSYGIFTRSFALPSSIDTDHVTADYKDGQLIVTMPKREEAKPKTIPVNVAEK